MTIISSNDAILKISGESLGVGQLLFVISVLLVTNPFGGGFSWVMVLPMMVAGFVVVRDMTTPRIDSETSSVLYRAGHIMAGSHGGRVCFIA